MIQAYALGILVLLILLPPGGEEFLLDPRRLGILGLLLTGTFAVIAPSALVFLYEKTLTRRMGNLGVFRDRLVLANRDRASAKNPSKVIEFGDLSEVLAHDFGLTLRLLEDGIRVGVPAPRNSATLALETFMAWCRKNEIAFFVEERTKSPFPVVLPRYKMTSVKVKLDSPSFSSKRNSRRNWRR